MTSKEINRLRPPMARQALQRRASGNDRQDKGLVICPPSVRRSEPLADKSAEGL